MSRSQDADGDVVTLLVDLKLEGLPMQRASLATCQTLNEVDGEWQQFLDLIAGPDVP